MSLSSEQVCLFEPYQCIVSQIIQNAYFSCLKQEKHAKVIFVDVYEKFLDCGKKVRLNSELDRFVGKVALGMQLYSMGFVGEPVISPSSEVCRMYEDLIDEHGDTLAWQYAGSQLVHSIKTYKKTSVIQVIFLINFDFVLVIMSNTFCLIAFLTQLAIK